MITLYFYCLAMSIKPNSKEKQDVANDSDDLGDLDDDDSLDHNN